MADVVLDEAALYKTVEDIENALTQMELICRRYKGVLSDLVEAGYSSDRFASAVQGDYAATLDSISSELKDIPAPLGGYCTSHVLALDHIDDFLY